MTKRSNLFMATLLACMGSGCQSSSPDALGLLIHMPALYWERARECKRRQALEGNRECRVTLEEIRDRRQAGSEPER